MADRYSLLLRGGRVVDPRNAVDGRLDLAIGGGQVVAVGEALDPGRAERVIDVSGRVVLPGVIDCHVHLGRWAGGAAGHRMLARAGTVTAIDFSGPVAETWESVLQSGGAGLNVGALEGVVYGSNVGSRDPGYSELAGLLERSLAAGALGFKIFGGHSPLSPRATADIVGVCQQAGAYVGFHAGTTRAGSNLEGFRDALEIIGDRPCHLAHVNAYCRGWVTGDAMEETREVLTALTRAEQVVTESHLAIWNGTLGDCEDGVPHDAITRRCLEDLGYEPTEDGLLRSIREGRCRVGATQGGENLLVEREAAEAAWRAGGGHVTVSFPVNRPICNFAAATERRPDGRFVVDALASDAGGIPRNNLVTVGLSLVRFGALALPDLATKLAWAPALMLGLSTKGHLGPGADGDVTVVDERLGQATLSIAGGQVIMVEGEPVGRGATVLTTRAGRAAVTSLGLSARVVDERPWRPYGRVPGGSAG